jgi:CRP-like cAMP-binding protein
MEDQVFGPLVRKLGKLAQLGEDDRNTIRTLKFRITHHPADHHLVREGDVPDRCCLLVEGYACRYKMNARGGRQIVSFHMAGDLLDLQHLMIPRADHSIMTIAASKIAWFGRDEVRGLINSHPAINEALWKDALIDASIHREWVLNVGRRSAKVRIAHMLCEFAARQQAAGLANGDHIELPMSQEHIADATGLTAIHVNRMMFALAADGVIVRNKRHIEITDWKRMRRLAEFDEAYLHEAA